MESIFKTVTKHKLITKTDVVGIAVSGGADSMCLLHALHELSKDVGFECVAITVDHGLREDSKKDASFVVNYCNKNNIKCYMYKVDVKKLSEDKGLSIEVAAREARYRIFRALVNKKLVNKIALGHHLQDQAETILLNIFRGTGLTGAGGMDVVRDGVYIRPQLYATKSDIMAYLSKNEIPYVEDYTNNSNEYNRNYIRNMIMPLVRARWQNADQTICSFADLCKVDEDFINSTINDSTVIYESDGTVKIPLNYFSYNIAVVNRILKKAFKAIGIFSNIERRHFKIINRLALEAENGSRISLPNKVAVFKEYNYLTISNKNFTPEQKVWELERGKIDVPNFGVIDMNVTRKLNFEEFTHLVDYNKIPKNAVWRYRRDGDVFTKFGGGTKSLSDYLIDKKIPLRHRVHLPVLAIGSDILVIGGVEISDKVKVDAETKTAWGINAVRF